LTHDPLFRPKLRTALTMAALATAMVGLGFASAPLYRLFCQVTGFGGTTQRGGLDAQVAAGQSIVVRFDANRAPALPWDFKAERPSQTVDIGARNIAFYTAKNLTGQPVTGRAVFNVTPVSAGGYFRKIQCFCFTLQTLQPGQAVRMPVTFQIDPKIATDPETRDIEEITLSYTFYPVDGR
jgi:cytochrome c oxidase assembly protein subunit 11